MIVTRFAPSPTGLLHLGHAFAAITAHDTAKARNGDAGGQFLVRIEDIDTARSREEFVDAILDDLTWLDLRWDGAVLRQSARFDAYREALDTLDRDGLLYPCFCTRKEIADEIARAADAPHQTGWGPEGAIYPGTCRHLSDDARAARMARGDPYALRMDLAGAMARAGKLTFREHGRGPKGETGTIAAMPEMFGDIVLARKETPASYHLAVVVDDAFEGVTCVTRGNDLFFATHIQRLLQALLHLPEPDYAHHRLILDKHGRKFSKRDRAITLKSLRETGETAKTIRARLGMLSA